MLQRQRQDMQRRRQSSTPTPVQPRYNWNTYRQGKVAPDWRQHRNFNPNAWQRNFKARNRFRWGEYKRPHGWYYRRWTFGMVLPMLFWTHNYWIDDYWVFGLASPPYGYVWVRYGDDALLVNVQTGLILRAVYSVYY